MPGQLRCDALDLSANSMVERLTKALTELARDATNTHRLEVDRRYYFHLPDGSITTKAGWYIICNADHSSLYVGSTNNLNSRLNTDDGSRDNFANPTRTTDPERNFIKAFASKGIIGPLQVVVIPERALCENLNLQGPLTNRDRGNVEKCLNIFREWILR